MYGATFITDLFGRAAPDTLRLVHPVETLTAILVSEREITCGEIKVTSPTPVQALCGALMSSGLEDSAMQVKSPRGEAVCFVQSIFGSARDGGRRP